MFRTLDGQNYWVNDVDEPGRDFMNRGSIRSITFLTAAVVGGIVLLMAVSLLPETLWWAAAMISLGGAAAALPVARIVAQQSSKVGELEREGVIANTNGHAFKVLAARLEDFEIDLGQITKEQECRAVWWLVTAYFLCVHEDAAALERGGLVSEESTKKQRSVGANASQAAELISGALEHQARCDRFVQACLDQVKNLGTGSKDESVFGEPREDVAAGEEGKFG